MQKKLKAALSSTFDFILYSNLFISFCFSSLAFQTFFIFQVPADYSLLVFIFCSSFFVYSFHRYTGLRKNIAENFRSAHLKWLIRHKKLTILVSMVLFPLVIFICFGLSFYHIIVLVPAIILALGYSVPVIPGVGSSRSLREIPGLKIFIISFVITYVTVLLPLVSVREFIIIDDAEFLLLFAERFFFIFGIAVPFDMRDVEYDRLTGTKTLPILLGEKKSKVLAILAIALSAVMAILLYYLHLLPASLLFFVLLTYLISTVFILRSENAESDYYFSFWMDGLMALPSMMVFCRMIILSA